MYGCNDFSDHISICPAVSTDEICLMHTCRPSTPLLISSYFCKLPKGWFVRVRKSCNDPYGTWRVSSLYAIFSVLSQNKDPKLSSSKTNQGTLELYGFNGSLYTSLPFRLTRDHNMGTRHSLPFFNAVPSKHKSACASYPRFPHSDVLISVPALTPVIEPSHLLILVEVQTKPGAATCLQGKFCRQAPPPQSAAIAPSGHNHRTLAGTLPTTYQKYLHTAWDIVVIEPNPRTKLKQ